MRKYLALGGLGVLTILLGGLAVMTVYAWRTGADLYLNVGVSLAPGWYLCLPVPEEGLLPLGAIVEVVPPAFAVEAVAAYFSGDVLGHWLKQVALGPTETVCLAGEEVRVGEEVIAQRPLLQRYALPAVEGCWTLGDDEVFVLGTHPRSWDSRYVGPLPRAAVKGLCEALWTWEGK